jgi:hypothetical protein
MTPLSFDMFQTLLAIGWIDGSLHPDEAEAILAAAVDARVAPADLERLRAMSARKVEFGDLTMDGMTREQRLYVYGVASFVARADATVTKDEQAGLHAVATLLGVSGKGRRKMDEVVDELRAEGSTERLDLVGLRRKIDAAVQAAALG